MAQIDIGKIKMVWKGAWDSSTAYTKDDAVSHSGSSYICIQDGTNQNPSTATAYWELLAQAGTNGTNGTDVGTTITTQGDILYRDGSGLQRLAAGTSGYFLKTQGSGANPVWSEVISGGLVKLGSTTLSSGANAIVLDNIFSSTYQAYRINIINYRTNADNGQPRILWRAGSSDISENWSSVYNYHYANFNATSGNTGGGYKKYTTEGGYIGNTWNFPDEGNFFTCDLMLSDGQKPIMHGLSSGKQGTGDSSTHWVQPVSMMSATDVNMGSSSHTGIKLYAMNGRDIQSGCKMVVYGCSQ